MRSSTLFLGLLILSSTSFGMLAEGTFQGGGEWKAVGKTKGNWIELMTVKADGRNFTVASHLKVLHNNTVVHEEKNSLQFIEKEPGFFDVKNGTEQIGTGYCFNNLCHYGYTKGKETGEETQHIVGNVIHKMGSNNGDEGGNKSAIAWFGKLEKK